MGQVLIPNGAAPATPAAGVTTIYPKTDKTLAYKDDAGNENVLSATNNANPWGYCGECMVDQVNSGSAYTITAAAAAAYTLDGWLASCTGANVTVQQVTVSGEFGNAIQLTGAAGVTGASLIARAESKNCSRFRTGSSVIGISISNSLLTSVTWTLSYANAADNFSAVTQIATGTLTVNSTQTRYSLVIPASANAGNGLQLKLDVGAQTSGAFIVTGVDQDFIARAYPHVTYDRVLSLAQWYFERLSYPAGGYPIAGGGLCVSTTAFQNITFPYRPKRTTPTITPSTMASFVVSNASGTPVALSTLTVAAANNTSGYMFGTVAAGLVVGNSTAIQTSAGTAVTIDLSSRL